MSALVAAVGLLLAIVLHVNQVQQSEIFLAFNAATVDNPQLWAGLTYLGDTAVTLCVMAPLLLIRPSIWMGVLAAIPVGGITSLTLKWLFDAPRPADILALTDFHVVGSVLRGHSFPSGHTITAFAAAGVVWACVWMEQRKNSANYIYRIVLASVLLLAFLVGVSRMAVGAHWPFDVLAGACVGWLAGLNGAYIAHRWQSTWNTDTARWLLHFLCCALTLDLIDKSLEDPVGVFMLWLGVLSAWGALIWKCFLYWKQR
jgi:membrane-associated phospholipid phosphatase